MLPLFPFGRQFNDKMGTYPLTQTDRLIATDAHYEHEVALKRGLFTALPTYYYQALPGHETAQWDVLETVLNNLTRFAPAKFTLRRDGDRWHWRNGRLNEATTFTFGDWATLPLDPLDWVGRQVPEDLTLLAGVPVVAGAVTLVAGQLCFGNGWCLDEKIGLPITILGDSRADRADGGADDPGRAATPGTPARWSAGVARELERESERSIRHD